MRSRHSIILCLGYTFYLVMGAVMFMFLEYDIVEETQVKEPKEWTRLKELALEAGPPSDTDEVQTLARWLPRACGAVPNRTLTALAAWGDQMKSVMEVEAACPHLHQLNVTQVVHYPWRFIDALYFAMTVTTTIGYGVLSPTTSGGRVMCIIYSLVGIPLTGILLAWTSESFGELLFKIFKSKLDKEKQHSHLIIGLVTTLYIGLGFFVFIFVPGVVFMILEGWTYLESIYYAYITLTTIGFGDFVSGTPYEGAILYVYQIFVILWIMVGLGYWVMVASFITKALKSKRLQTSFSRSADEVKRLMNQMGVKQPHDPVFLRQHSKATINLMLQLSNMIALQDGVDCGGMMSEGDLPSSPGAASTTSNTTTTTTGPSSPTSPPLSPLGIPGISSLFGPGFSRTTPFSNLMGPMKQEYVISSTPPSTPKRKSFEIRVVIPEEAEVINEDKDDSDTDLENCTPPISSCDHSSAGSPTESTGSPYDSGDFVSLESPLTERLRPQTLRSDSQAPLTSNEESRL